jgi:hypothetical protein
MKRQRGDVTSAFDLTGQGRTELNGSIISSQTHSINRWNGRLMNDETNGLWTDTRLREKWGSVIDIGSPMDLIKVEWDFPISGTGAGNTGPPGTILRRYDGPIIAYPPAGYPVDLYDPVKARSYAVVDHPTVRWGLGGQAIAACRPAKPEATFGQFLVELYREGVPSLLQRLDVRDKVEFFRGLGGNYLNVEFGWKPFVADIRKTIASLRNAEAILDDLYRNNGQFMRRRYSFPEIRTVSEESGSTLPWPTLTTTHWTQTTRLTRTTNTKRTWFSGEFKYHLPPRGSVRTELGLWQRHLLGVDLTPELLWNVAPWTWLSDWFLSFGDVISNATAISSDNLVLRYGYLMQEATREVNVTHLGVSTRGYGSVNPTVSGTLRINQKTRMLASPYGFGLTQGDLTPRQWAILLALGLVKNPGGVRSQNG